MRRRLPRPTLFPYTTLFRSLAAGAPALAAAGWALPPLARTLHVLGVGGALALVDFAPALFVGAAVTGAAAIAARSIRSEEHTSELQSQSNLVCRLLLEKKKK